MRGVTRRLHRRHIDSTTLAVLTLEIGGEARWRRVLTITALFAVLAGARCFRRWQHADAVGERRRFVATFTHAGGAARGRTGACGGTHRGLWLGFERTRGVECEIKRRECDVLNNTNRIM